MPDMKNRPGPIILPSGNRAIPCNPTQETSPHLSFDTDRNMSEGLCHTVIIQRGEMQWVRRRVFLYPSRTGAKSVLKSKSVTNGNMDVVSLWLCNPNYYKYTYYIT